MKASAALSSVSSSIPVVILNKSSCWYMMLSNIIDIIQALNMQIKMLHTCYKQEGALGIGGTNLLISIGITYL